MRSVGQSRRHEGGRQAASGDKHGPADCCNKIVIDDADDSDDGGNVVAAKCQDRNATSSEADATAADPTAAVRREV